MSSPCKSWSGKLTAWFDGEMGREFSVEVREHLIACPSCRSAVSSWRKLRQDFAALQGDSVSTETLTRIHARLDEALAHEVRHLGQALKWWTVAASILAFVGLLALFSQEVESFGRASASALLEVDRAFEELLSRSSPPVPREQ